MNENQLRYDLAAWYNKYKRDLPWRHTSDPYKIWISEIMLQQTQVETVKPYYLNFIEHFPDVQSLACAPMEDLLKQWEGLGYYRRARHLKEAAVMIVETFGGEFPHTYEDILTLKGIGNYTASAISSIAFGIPKGVIDGNTLRILSRIYNRQDNIALDKTRKLYQQLIDHLISPDHPSEFNQGMMDLGATVCTPRKPQCDKCPLQKHCEAYLNGTQGLLPVNLKCTNKTDIYLITAFIKKDNRYLLVKNKPGLLENLYGFVQYEVESPRSFEELFESEFGAPIRLNEYVKEVKHVFSHRIWHMHVYTGNLSHEIKGSLYTKEEMLSLPISTAHLKVLNAVTCGF